ncbi:hydroxymethylglutaryl-CoA reductase [Phaeocystidibacter luteus]|uniref:hydroxymethylglutaryl-CoA reductase (NADPH) n=1 Tax=Phaeocystidibacter luteus TaxID=911197 RepID=A0A6N6RFF1_9FLAO|nr:hydroxymethylglutaryl-CoA reductase [Phaeocystidibacter luteus]KAB2809885.1 hydroxymethylglutaryl-CoA reductase [Phaeocystidibacter luteus]
MRNSNQTHTGIPNGSQTTSSNTIPTAIEAVEERRALLTSLTKLNRGVFLGAESIDDSNSFVGNIENYVGMTMVPTGVMGPIVVHGTKANGEYYVPLATSEGALVASYHRGAKACSVSGGVTSMCVKEGVQRSPTFAFSNLEEAGVFIAWTTTQKEAFKAEASKMSRFGEMQDMKVHLESSQVTLIFEYTTGDASGQNMVTICTDAVCRYILENTPVQPRKWYIEGNFSGDKKATASALNHVRGKKVIAEVELKPEVVASVLKSNPENIVEYWKNSTLNIIQSGALGAQGHYANGLTALFMATGQDVACIAEAGMGVTRMEIRPSGNLYVSVTLPNLIVGTVGGGTSLPTQAECLKMMDCYGAGNAVKFAEICAATVLAGEISIAAAIAEGHFTSAHKNLGRK